MLVTKIKVMNVKDVGKMRHRTLTLSGNRRVIGGQNVRRIKN